MAEKKPKFKKIIISIFAIIAVGAINKQKIKKIIISIVAIVAVCAIVISAFTILRNHYYDKLTYDPDNEMWGDEQASGLLTEFDETTGVDSPLSEIEKLEQDLLNNALKLEALNPISSDEVYNILLIGTDARNKEDRGRADTIVLASINTQEEKIFLTSFLRDIYVSIPGVGNNRLNAAYVYGGASLLIKTIEQNFGIKIDNYMKTDFFSFIEIIDSIGTVDLEVTAEEISYMNRYIREVNQLSGIDKQDGQIDEADAGLLYMNGKQALAYARLRKVGSDFTRTDRQRKVLMQVAKKLKKMSRGEQLQVLQDALPNVVTDLTEDEFKAMILKSSEYMSYQIKCMTVPVSGSWKFVTINGMEVISIDFNKNIAAIEDWIYSTDKSETTTSTTTTSASTTITE